MLALRKLLKLPGPVELGRSSYDALPSRDFTPDTTDYCWEDWHAEVKALHPIKYWISETAADFIRFNIWFPVRRPFKDAHYWLVSHLNPKRRHHMLDLRQPGGYQYGWIDVDARMLFAMFNLLKKYFEEKPYDLTADYTLEQINADAALKNQHETLQEARDILNWWTVQRIKDQAIKDELLTRWCALRKEKVTRDSGEADQVWAVMKKADSDYEEKTDEMITRLMKIRRSLWT